MSHDRYIRVAVPAPLRRHFDYLPASGQPLPAPGCRVRVPFGRRKLVGVVVDHGDESDVEPGKLRPVLEVLDQTPLIPGPLLELLTRASRYYHHPVGEVYQTALPVALRDGAAADSAGPEVWYLDAGAPDDAESKLVRAPVQARLISALRVQGAAGMTVTELREQAESWRGPMRALASRGWVSHRRRPCLEAAVTEPVAAPVPTPDQQRAIDAILARGEGFHSLLLHGITGSGKTEVYLRAIAEVLARGRQALVLVPEIGLTPQLVDRFRGRFPVPIAVLHSRLTDQERLCSWVMAASGRAPVVLGTRSAVFTPLARPGLIVVDEEHDGSYKQQDGFRYHARDLAVMRAQIEQVPVVLGSATPSLESLHNARRGRFELLELPARPGTAELPEVHLLDLRTLPVEQGISRPLRQALRTRLERGEQSLLFLNRRGFAPVLMCYDCGWLAPCRRCDARMTLHRGSNRLRCHHCGAEAPLPQTCGTCGGTNLHGIGEGTERIEAVLGELFPAARILRVDRDTTARKGALEESLRRIHAGEADILVGTQMLSKGHDFPAVTLVGVLNADQGLFGFDFRAGEYLFQRIMQVAGRAGRADRPGQVLIQTWHPDNPYLQALARHDFHAFADYAMAEREEAELAPYNHLALLRAESTGAGDGLRFLGRARALAMEMDPGPVTVLDPVPSPMERRAGRYRAQLLVQSSDRVALHRFLDPWLERLDRDPEARKVRWSCDVDPMDMY